MAVMSGHNGEPIAVIGFACRTAGAEGPEDLWQRLTDGARLIQPVPEGRVPSIDTGLVEASHTQAALVDDIAGFDAPFFGISRRMTAWMDPHQRVLLELTWHALEDAALVPEDLTGVPVGVFASAPMADYRERMIHANVVDSAAFSGTLNTFAANRVSYQFDWTGPSYTIDSACSSGLSVLAPAVQGLRSGEFPLAAVMAANVTCNGFYTSTAYQAGALSPTGESVPFSAGRDGYVRGEGGACLLLKRLDSATRDGDPVHAVIRGIGIAHNGRAGGLTGSDAGSQTRLIRDTAQATGVSVSSVGYMEAHGTGTVGDLAEIEGIAGALYAEQDSSESELAGPEGKMWVGSVKSNIGHLETAAGLLSVVKSLLILRHGLIPPIAGLDRIDPAIKLDGMPLALADRSIPWPAGRAVRRIGVNSFGVGGALAHALVEEPPVTPPASVGKPIGTTMCVPLSAGNRAALCALAARHLDALDGIGPLELASYVWTVQTGRAALPERRLLLASDPHELRSALKAVAADAPHDRVAAPGSSQALYLLPDTVVKDATDWLDGARGDWRAHWASPPPRRTGGLPRYPFQRRTHWFDAHAPASLA
ncbi:polyketide synthase (plasmid) [Streptomyces globisporus]|uniref:beta-ketoacyl [acyl carrier protein] synthase domain-containing protein n=1 Tax=Streptomyces globisporus TaxID=1908 RepID=UPI002F9076C3|nr:polyketide synthase [Streptomyces globisporus]